MDITRNISDLLYYHNCIIIPGFGGFVCSHRQAQIHPVLNTLSPPSKAISFNINLRHNDGLLANHLSKTAGITYQQALQYIETWVASSVSILDLEKELPLKNIGRLSKDIEGGWQFAPDETINYLPSSFGLPVITAAPVIREREISIPVEKALSESKTISATLWSNWKIAAMVMLIFGIGAISALMFTGRGMEPLKLNEAGVMSALLHISGNAEPALKPIPPATVEAVKTEDKSPDNSQTISTGAVTTNVPAVNENPDVTANSEATQQGKYYIIVGVFGSHYNVEMAKKRLLATIPSTSLYEEKHNGLTRIGYWAGNNAGEANEELISARAENASYWLLQKSER